MIDGTGEQTITDMSLITLYDLRLICLNLCDSSSKYLHWRHLLYPRERPRRTKPAGARRLDLTDSENVLGWPIHIHPSLLFHPIYPLSLPVQLKSDPLKKIEKTRSYPESLQPQPLPRSANEYAKPKSSQANAVDVDSYV